MGRYDAWKKGDYEAAKNPIPTELSNANTGMALIDFDDAAESNLPAAQGGNTADDLMGLFGPSASAPVPPLATKPTLLPGFTQQPTQQQPSYASPTPSFATHTQGGPAPVLIRIETKAGHGAGKPTGKIIEEYSDLWAFALDQMGVKPTAPVVEAPAP